MQTERLDIKVVCSKCSAEWNRTIHVRIPTYKNIDLSEAKFCDHCFEFCGQPVEIIHTSPMSNIRTPIRLEDLDEYAHHGIGYIKTRQRAEEAIRTSRILLDNLDNPRPNSSAREWFKKRREEVRKKNAELQANETEKRIAANVITIAVLLLIAAVVVTIFTAMNKPKDEEELTTAQEIVKEDAEKKKENDVWEEEDNDTDW